MKCPYCGAEAVLRDADYVHHHLTNYGKIEQLWVCSNYPECDAYVGCHKGTQIPLGRLANHALRNLKKEAHRQFDPLWRSGLMSRRHAYNWLSDMLDIPMSECHIGMFNEKQCRKTIELCKKQKNPKIMEYRNRHY